MEEHFIPLFSKTANEKTPDFLLSTWAEGKLANVLDSSLQEAALYIETAGLQRTVMLTKQLQHGKTPDHSIFLNFKAYTMYL